MPSDVLEDVACSTERLVKVSAGPSPAHRVMKNSAWLIVQPLVLNFISIFATAYIVRALGKEEYGIFVFSFAFIAIFFPITNIGLRMVTVREISENKEGIRDFIGKMMMLRVSLSVIAIFTVLFVGYFLGYTAQVKLIITIVSLTILFNAISGTSMDVFQAFEKMEYTAYAQFISGIVLTALSVIVLFLGYGLIGLTVVYVFGSFLGLVVALRIVLKKFVVPNFKMDMLFCKSSLIKGVPFFFPGLLGLFGDKIGIVLLASLAGNASVGIFAAGSILVDRLNVIPDGICTAIFPSLASLYKTSKSLAAELFNKFFIYLFLLALPLAVGTTILAKPIILLIFGDKFQQSIIILQILAWWLFFSFITAIEGWALGAIHQEKKGALVRFITVPCFIVILLLLVPTTKERGVAVANLITGMISFVILSFLVKKHFGVNILKNRILVKIILANILMGVIVFICRQYNVILVSFGGGLLYFAALLIFGVIRSSDLLYIREFFIK